MSNFYIHIDENGICTSIASLAGPIEEDYRTIKVDTYDVSYVGKKYENGAFVVDPPLVVAQKAKIAELDAAAAEALKTCQSSALGTAHTYLTDKEEAWPLLTGEYAFVKGNDYDGNPIPWYTVEDGYVDHTADQFSQVYLDCRANVQAVKVKHDTLVRQVNAATTTAEVEAIVW
jgi:hypothetical protein